MKGNCENCAYMITTEEFDHRYKDQDRGMCVRYPPQVVLLANDMVGSQLPVVNKGFACGEWKER